MISDQPNVAHNRSYPRNSSTGPIPTCTVESDGMDLALSDFLAHLADRNRSLLTIRRYGELLRRFHAFACEELHCKAVAPADVDKALVVLFVREGGRQGSRASASTRNSRLAALRAFFHYLVAEDRLARDPSETVAFLPLFKPARIDFILLLHEFTSAQGRKTVEVHGVINPLELEDFQEKYEAYGKALLARHRLHRIAMREWVEKCSPAVERYRADKERLPQFAYQMNRYLTIAEAELKAVTAWLDGAEPAADALIREQTHGRLASPDALVEQARRYRASAAVAYTEATLLATVMDAATGETLWAGRFTKQHPTAGGAVETVVERLVKTLLKGTAGVRVSGT